MERMNLMIPPSDGTKEWDSPIDFVIGFLELRRDLRRERKEEILYPRISVLEEIIAARVLGYFLLLWEGDE